MKIYNILILFLILNINFLLYKSDDSKNENKCDLLKSKAIYRQDEAPRDITEMLTIVTNKINREINYVTRVKVDYKGDNIHSIVGLHNITAIVTQQIKINNNNNINNDNLNDEKYENIQRCFILTFEIIDTDECQLDMDHPMHHRCHNSAECINTNGSYECGCKDPFFATDDSSNGLCAGHKNTSTCCLKKSKLECIENFKCQINMCPDSCHKTSICSYNEKGQAICTCPNGYYGNGKPCKDNQPPSLIYANRDNQIITKDYNNICGCQKPLIDYCWDIECGEHAKCVNMPLENGAKCQCDEGFIWVDEQGCMDLSPPKLKLKNDNPIILKQCQSYEEYGIEVIDNNAEEYARTLQINYSFPLGSCLTDIGTHYVNYTIETKWTNPPFITETRKVIIEDVNECLITKNLNNDNNNDNNNLDCDDCISRCVPDANCINLPGSYKCQCPKGTAGDGFEFHTFRPNAIPDGFINGSGCIDIEPPKIELIGPNPYIFETIKPSHLATFDDDINNQIICNNDYEQDIKDILHKTRGNYFCNSNNNDNDYANLYFNSYLNNNLNDNELNIYHENLKNNNIKRCVYVYDDTIHGRVNLISRLEIGDPIRVFRQNNDLVWKIPYNVVDESGNRADTVYREIIINELTTKEYTKKILELSQNNYEKKINQLENQILNVDNEQREYCECKPCPKCKDCSKLIKQMNINNNNNNNCNIDDDNNNIDVNIDENNKKIKKKFNNYTLYDHLIQYIPEKYLLLPWSSYIKPLFLLMMIAFLLFLIWKILSKPKNKEINTSRFSASLHRPITPSKSPNKSSLTPLTNNK